MATLRDAGAGEVRFTPISSALANLPNGAGTMAVLLRVDANNIHDVMGLVDTHPVGSWYHVLTLNNVTFTDDDGIGSAVFSGGPSYSLGSTADDFQIVVLDWPAGGAATERLHISGDIGGAESWAHGNSAGNNGGNRAGPAASGHFSLGALESAGTLQGDIALVAVWAGTRFSDADAQDLWINKRTSDWWKHPVGPPTLLVECNTVVPIDIGKNPSNYNSMTGVTLAGLDPTGWTFDGRGELRFNYGEFPR